MELNAGPFVWTCSEEQVVKFNFKLTLFLALAIALKACSSCMYVYVTVVPDRHAMKVMIWLRGQKLSNCQEFLCLVTLCNFNLHLAANLFRLPYSCNNSGLLTT